MPIAFGLLISVFRALQDIAYAPAVMSDSAVFGTLPCARCAQQLESETLLKMLTAKPCVACAPGHARFGLLGLGQPTARLALCACACRAQRRHRDRRMTRACTISASRPPHWLTQHPTGCRCRCAAPAKLQCPKCIELKLAKETSVFCSQDCFKVRCCARLTWLRHATCGIAVTHSLAIFSVAASNGRLCARQSLRSVQSLSVVLQSRHRRNTKHPNCNCAHCIPPITLCTSSIAAFIRYWRL